MTEHRNDSPDVKKPTMSPEEEARSEPTRPVEEPSSTGADQGPLGDVDAEALAGAVGRRLARRPESAAWDDARFANWVARDSEDEARRARPWSDARVLTAGEALRARALARRLRVSQLAHHPRERAPDVAGSPADVLREAATAGATPAVDLGAAAGAGREIWDEPCEAWIDLPPDVPSGRYVALRIVGDSMAPLMHTGDTVLVRIDTRVERDTIVVARHPEDGYVCKRVRRLTRATIELDSLAPGRPAITIPRDERLVVGTVVLVWCAHGRRESDAAQV